MSQTFVKLEDSKGSEILFLNIPELRLEEIINRLSITSYKGRVTILSELEVPEDFLTYCEALGELLNHYELENFYKVSANLSKNILWLSSKTKESFSVSFEMLALSHNPKYRHKNAKTVAARLLQDLLVKMDKPEQAFRVCVDYLEIKS